MNPYVRALLGGLLGGLLGAGIWAAISYFTNREIGWIAWGVGGLTGLGVRYFARESDGGPFGLIAIGISVVAILLGKFLAVMFIAIALQNQINALDLSVDEEGMIETKAEEVAREWKAKGKMVTPTNSPVDEAKKNYTPAVKAEALKRWKAIPSEEQKRLISAANANIEKSKSEVGGEVVKKGFLASFSPFDIIWFLLAAITAFKLGSGLTTHKD